ncbi:MAG: hypothetical protein JWO58_525 [Chitinophagaceae bacterium]|nr:hypothetical protein [Chitinophagaceae bacterium]
MPLSKKNNFDLIRLFAAVQVLIIHASEHLQLEHSGAAAIFIRLLSFFPGVPVFFTISGFLIMWSYERNRDKLLSFYTNRLLRIYPALWVCLIVTIVVLLTCHTITVSQLFHGEILIWVITQISFLQFYTPDALRSFGVGTPNGSLWTISLELQFYLVVPILYILTQRGRHVFMQYVTIVGIIAISVLTYCYAKRLPDDGIPSKLMGVFLLPYLYNFMFGIVLYIYWSQLEKMILGKGVYWLLGYLLYSLVCSSYLGWYSPSYWPNVFGFIANIVLSITIISLAFTCTAWSERLLKGNDFSYGIYIYHMLVVNVFVYLGYTGSYIYLVEVFLVTCTMAIISWFCVEHPALRFKKRISR